MAKAKTPVVSLAQKSIRVGTALIELDSPAWQAWLLHRQAFAVAVGPGQDFSVRWLAARGIWAAYRTVGGVQVFTYLRRGEEPTAERLATMNADLWGRMRAQLSDDAVDALIAAALAPLAPLFLGSVRPETVVESLTGSVCPPAQENSQARNIAIRIFAALQRLTEAPVEH